MHTMKKEVTIRKSSEIETHMIIKIRTCQIDGEVSHQQQHLNRRKKYKQSYRSEERRVGKEC